MDNTKHTRKYILSGALPEKTQTCRKESGINGSYEKKEKLFFACFGDSITSDQVTGIGSRVAELLGLELTGNFACGYATLCDWHEGKKNITPFSLDVPMDTNTADNVLSNQVFRCLKEVKEHPEKKPDVIYIAAGINDGNQPFNTVEDDTENVLAQPFEELDRTSMASALRWAVETLRAAFPEALVFAATPLYSVIRILRHYFSFFVF